MSLLKTVTYGDVKLNAVGGLLKVTPSGSSRSYLYSISGKHPIIGTAKWDEFTAFFAKGGKIFVSGYAYVSGKRKYFQGVEIPSVMYPAFLKLRGKSSSWTPGWSDVTYYGTTVNFQFAQMASGVSRAVKTVIPPRGGAVVGKFTDRMGRDIVVRAKDGEAPSDAMERVRRKHGM